MKIWMFVFNNCSRDARVLKEAKCLANQGHEVVIHAVWDKTVEFFEKKDGFEIVRITKDPLHYKLVRGIKSVVKFFILLIKMLLMPMAAVVNWLEKIAEWFAKPRKKDEIVLSQKKILPIVKLFKYLQSFFRKTKKSLKCFLKNKAKSFKSSIGKSINSLFMPIHRPLCFIDFYVKCYKLAKSTSNVDVYHAHDLNTLPVAWLCRKHHKKKLVYDSHELYCETSTLSKIEKTLSKITERCLIKKANGVITVNQSISEELSKRYNIAEPIVVMNCPERPIEQFENHEEEDLFRSALNIDKNVPLILYHGGFSPNRGLENLIDSANFINSGLLIMMGWGKIEDDLKGRVERQNLGSKVKFLPPVSQRDLLRWTKCADVGMIPYQFVGLNNYYSSPNKLFEYIMAGIPVAGSYFPELKRVIEGFKIGKTFNPDDPKDIAKAINEILTDKESYMKYRKNTEKTAQIYNWENESKKLINLYKSLESAG